MKRYWLFAGNAYYPARARGGMDDYHGSYDSVREAHEIGNTFDWYHVFDTETHERINRAGHRLGPYE